MRHIGLFFIRAFGGLPKGYYFRQFLWGLIYSLIITATGYFFLEYAAPVLSKAFPSFIKFIVYWRHTTQDEILVLAGFLLSYSAIYPYSRLIYSRFFRSILNGAVVYMPVKAMITLNFINGLVSLLLTPALAPVCFIYLFFSNKPSAKPKKPDDKKDASNLYL